MLPVANAFVLPTRTVKRLVDLLRSGVEFRWAIESKLPAIFIFIPSIMTSNILTIGVFVLAQED